MPTNVEDGWMDGAWRSWIVPDRIVRGESHYGTALLELTGPPRPRGYLVPVVVVLRLEPENPYDPHAVRVEVSGQIVGHIARELAPAVREAIRALDLTSCAFAGLLRGGYLSDTEDRRDVGVMLWPTRRVTPGPSLQQIGGPGFLCGSRWPPDDGRDWDNRRESR